MKQYWKNEYEYKRVLEILEDYWLTEKDEAYVRIQLDFAHRDGQTQGKCIRWYNPNLSYEDRRAAEKLITWR